MDKPHNTNHASAITCAALLCILLLALGLRVYEANVSFWLDEIDTYLVSTSSFEYIFHYYTSRAFPLYFCLARLCLFISDSEFMVRLPSILAGVASVFAIFKLAKSLYGRTAGLVAALLLATAPYHIHYSQEARFYAVLVLESLLFAWALERATAEGGLRRWIIALLIAIPGMLTHLFYFPFFLVMAGGAGLFVLSRKPLINKRKISQATLLCLLSLSIVGIFGGLYSWDKHFVGDNSGFGIGRPIDQSKKFLDVINQAENSPEAERLTLANWATFYHEFLGSPARPVAIISIVFAVWGLIEIGLRRPAMGFILVSTILVVPMPFFLLRVIDGYHSRYFIIELPVLILSLGVGITAAAARIGALIARGDRVAPVIANAIVLVVLGLFVPSQVGILRAYYEQHLYENWRGVATEMAKTAAHSDVVAFYEPRGRWRVLKRPLEFYLSRVMRPNEMRLITQFEIKSGKDLEGVLKTYPDSTVWFVTVDWGLPRMPEDLKRVVDGIFTEKHSFGRQVLFAAPKPGTNLIAAGGFEDEKAQSYARTGIDLVERGGPGQPGHCLRLYAEENRTVLVRFPIGKMVYALRNAGFEAWDKTGPIGWTFAGGDVSGFAQSKEARSGAACLEIKAATNEMCVMQRRPMGLAPGRNIEVKTFGRASAPMQLALILHYTVGLENKQVTVYHPGDNEWHELILREALPPETDPNSILIQMARLPVGPDSVYADDVVVDTDAPVGMVDPTQEYVFSADLKLGNVIRGLNAARLVRIDVEAVDARGATISADMVRIDGTSDWKRVSFGLKDGLQLPPHASNVTIVIGIREARGTLWIDNVQLTPRDQTSPGDAVTTLPHDEALAALGLPSSLAR